MNTQHLTRSSWTRVRQLVNARDGETCQYCGKQAPDGDVDHILPLSKGGRDSLDNLVWSCRRCNREKSDKTLYEWLMSVRGTVHAADYEPFEILPLSKATTKKDRAISWFLDLMTHVSNNLNGEIAPRTVFKMAKEAGFSRIMIDRIKRDIDTDDNGIHIESMKRSAAWKWVISTDEEV